MIVSSPIEDVLFALLAEIPPGKSVSPEQVARAMDAEGWRRLLPQIRSTVRGLARQRRVVITRHGKPADPESFKGVYRLRAADAEPSAAVGPLEDAGDAD